MTNEPREWGAFVLKAMELAGTSQSGLARLLSQKLKTQMTQGAVHSRLRNANGLPPRDEDELKAWADALKLDGHHRETFYRLAYLERTPPKIRAELTMINDLLTRGERRISVLEREREKREKELKQLREELAQAAAQVAALLAKQR